MIRAVLVLSENWELVAPRDLRTLVSMAVEAEEAGFDAVMVSEHVVLGADAGAAGRPGNPRDYAMPGTQDPATPWPSSIVLLSAVAARTSRLRVVAAALIAPLRHPLVLAQELAALDLLSEGRLVVQPTVSWHRAEYVALGVPFERRGEVLDEHLDAWRAVWTAPPGAPASYHGRHVRFDDVFLEPKPYRPDGVRMWFGGDRVHPAILDRLVRHGHGFHPLGRPSDDDLAAVRAAWAAGPRAAMPLELVGGIRATFDGPTGIADLGPAVAAIPDLVRRGMTTVCVKPSMFLDDRRGFVRWCRAALDRMASAASSP